MPTLTQMEYIVAVDKHRHFGKAAEACFVSQPSLSMQIQKLEDELEIVVFDRSKKPIVPTKLGQAVVDQAKVVVGESQKLLGLKALKETEVSGEYRLGVIPTLAPYVIPLFISNFAKAYPNVDLKVEELKTSEIMTALDDDQIDAGLLVTPLNEDRFEEKILFYEPFYLYVGQNHPYYKRARVREADLETKDIWLLGEGHCLRNQVVRLCDISKKGGVINNVHFESGNLETLKRLVDNSDGYTLMPHLAVMDYKDSATKKRVKPFIKPVPTREVSLAFRRKHLRRDILDALAETIIKSVPKVLFDLREHDIEIVDI